MSQSTHFLHATFPHAATNMQQSTEKEGKFEAI
jgi:hypothetical protein